MVAARECSTKDKDLTYNEDGHLYTTFAVTRISLGNDSRAYTISYYAQYPDLDPAVAAVDVSVSNFLTPWNWSAASAINSVIHSLHGGGHAAVASRREALSVALTESLRDRRYDWRSGLIAHALADSYAHTSGALSTEDERAFNSLFGHLWSSMFGTDPDEIIEPGKNPKFLAYVNSLFQATNQGEEDSDGRFAALLTKLNSMKCFGRQCSDFLKLFDGENSPGINKVALFEECMNSKARRLHAYEIADTIEYINGVAQNIVIPD